MNYSIYMNLQILKFLVHMLNTFSSMHYLKVKSQKLDLFFCVCKTINETTFSMWRNKTTVYPGRIHCTERTIHSIHVQKTWRGSDWTKTCISLGRRGICPFRQIHCCHRRSDTLNNSIYTMLCQICLKNVKQIVIN